MLCWRLGKWIHGGALSSVWLVSSVRRDLQYDKSSIISFNGKQHFSMQLISETRHRGVFKKRISDEGDFFQSSSAHPE
jgi:hypothetical protein